MDEQFVRDQWKKLKDLKLERSELSKRIKQVGQNIDNEIDPEAQPQTSLDLKPPKPTEKAPKKKAKTTKEGRK